MRLRHAAALAVLGWYLMAPGNQFAHDAAGGLIPTKWYRLGSFETEAQCDQALKALKTKVAAAYSKQRKSGHRLTFQMGDNAECDDAKLTPSLSNWPALKLN